MMTRLLTSALLAGAWVLLLPGISVASPESQRLTAEGSAALGKGRREDALSLFGKAAVADPDDPRALFFKGLVLNDLKRPAEAIEALNRAGSLGGGHPDIEFEKGRSFFRLGRWFDAAGAFERHDLAVPGRAATSAYLGRAYLLLDDYARSELNLKEAIRREPRLAPSLEPFLSLINTVRADAVEGARLLAVLRRQITGEEEGEEEKAEKERERQRERDEERKREEERKKERKRADEARNEREATRDDELRGLLHEGEEAKAGLNASLRFETGYNSNALVLGVGRELPSGVSHKHAAFARAGAFLGYGRSYENGARISAAYAYAKTAFDGLHELEQDDNLLRLDARYRTGLFFGVALRATDRYTQIGQKGFWNRAAVRPSVLFWHGGVAELSWEHAWLDYYPDVAPVFERDGSSDTLELAESWTLLGGKAKPRLAVSHTKNRAEGDDFDSQGTEGSAGGTVSLPWSVTVEAAYRMGRERFDHGNTQAEPAFSRRRKDTVRAVDLQLRRPIGGTGAVAFVRYLLTESDSNVRFYQYDQHVSQAGIDISF